MVTQTLFSVYAPRGIPWQGTAECLVICGHCGAENVRDVDNTAQNQFACHKCDNSIQQFVHATTHTIRSNYGVVAARLHSINTRLPERNKLEIYNSLSLINSRRDPVVQICRIRVLNETPFFENFTPLITPASNLNSWHMRCLVPIDFFPRQACRVAIELEVTNTWGDRLATHLSMVNTLALFRHMIQADLQLLSIELPALAQQFRQFEAQGNIHNGQFEALVFEMVDFLLNY